MNDFVKNIRVPNSDSLFGRLWEWVNFEIALKFIVLYICIIWVAIVVWVIKDITNRTSSIIGQILSILLVLLFPFVGIFIYLMVRPSHTLLERYYGEVEENLDMISEFIAQQTQLTQDNMVAAKKAEKRQKKYQTKSEKKKQKKLKHNN